MNKIILFIVIILLLNLNCKNNPVEVKQENRKPVIFSVTVFPDIVKPGDSLIVVCNAYDPDGDTLVYDWITDARVKIKGTNSEQDWLYNTYENFQVLYPNNLNNIPVDTLWVQCFARDGKGESDNKLIFFLLKK
jgi:hypothetical protein